MSGDLAFACKCGTVAGKVQAAGPKAGDRVVCHCENCQEFAYFCDAENRLLDANGGTDLYNTRCAQVTLQRGQQNLACIHLTDKPTLRWYATCCDTPMFNTFATGRVPYVTIAVVNCDPSRRDEVLGRPLGHLFLQDARGDTSGLRAMSPLSLLGRVLPRMAMDMFSGSRRRTALFDPKSLAPIASPHRLTPSERANLREKVAS